MRLLRAKAPLALLILALAIAALPSPAASGQPREQPGQAQVEQPAQSGNHVELSLDDALDQLARRFKPIDWAVIAAYLAFTTLLGALLAGRQATIRDFFLGGRKLPWLAVCGSIIATELSAATFLIVPAIVFKQGGDLTYLQLAIGTIAARFVIGYFFVPAFYEREIYSPYDYMGRRLGENARKLTTALFMIGAVLAQGARVYIAALALQVVTGTNIAWSIIIIGAVSILWTWLGGIRTVIWTDVLQFLLFSGGALAAFLFIGRSLDGGLVSILRESYQAGKLNILDTTLDTKTAYTLWCGLFATGWLTLASHGTDQMTAQRMFTCRDARAARKAIIWSSASQLLTVLLMLVGAGLWVYYRHHGLDRAESVVVGADSMKVFAVFIVDALPAGLSGLLMAAIFAAAISTLDSVLAALSQSTLATIFKPLRRKPLNMRGEVLASRLFVVFWGLVLTAFAISCDSLRRHYADLVQFALAMTAYTYGALLGTFLLALLPRSRGDVGLLWAVPLSMLTVLALAWDNLWTQLATTTCALLLLLAAIWWFRNRPLKIACVSLSVALILLIEFVATGRGPTGEPIHLTLVWPWHYPIGTAVTFLLGHVLGETVEKDRKSLDATGDATYRRQQRARRNTQTVQGKSKCRSCAKIPLSAAG